MHTMKKLKKKNSKRTVQAYGCIACYGLPEKCAANCGGNMDMLQTALQGELDIEYLSIYHS